MTDVLRSYNKKRESNSIATSPSYNIQQLYDRELLVLDLVCPQCGYSRKCGYTNSDAIQDNLPDMFLYSEVKKKGEIFMAFLKFSESEQRDPTYPGVAYKCFTDT